MSNEKDNFERELGLCAGFEHVELNTNESRLLKLFRGLPPDVQEYFLSFVDFLQKDRQRAGKSG